MRLKHTLTALAPLTLSILATLSAPAAPVLAKEQEKPEPARVYKDWVVGCHWSCEAVAVMPEADAEGYVLTMSMEVSEFDSEDVYLALHDPIGEALQIEKGPFLFLVDGKSVATFVWSHYPDEWRASLKRSNATILAKGKMGEIVDKDGKRVSLISLNGATAAMRDMDERLGIAGYTHALVAKGKKRGKKESSPSPFGVRLPNMPKIVVSTPPLLTEVMDSAIKLSGCADDRDDVDARFDAIHPLERNESDPDQALILVGCGHVAYNYNVMPLLAIKDKSGQWTINRLIFDSYGDSAEVPMPMLTNATWNAKTRELTHYNKGRGLGDCGETAIYWMETSGKAWLTGIREMPVCRGATYWPRIW